MIGRQTIVAREFYYHRFCYKKLVKKRDLKSTVSCDVADKIFNELTAIIKAKMINNCEVLRMTYDVSTLYSEVKDRLFVEESDQVHLPSPQKLKEKIEKIFGKQIGFWQPANGSELLYNDIIKKGQ